MTSLEQLAFLMQHHGTSLARKELLCSQDVADALAALIPERDPPDPLAWTTGIPDSLAWATGIQVIPTPDSPPGTWRLIRHDGCSVLDQTVTHEKCTVLADSYHAWPPGRIAGD